MGIQSDWNPELYLQFGNERTQPSLDLVSRINLTHPEKIIDVGCGPGNSTQILASRWSESRICGIDNSPAMIEKARMDYPSREWEVNDARSIRGKWDLVFSNAVIQWIPDHENLIEGLLSCVAAGGALAVQVPLYFDMPVKKVVDEEARLFGSAKNFPVLENIMTIHGADFYYDILSAGAKQVSLWKTSYLHVMDGHRSIVDMIRSTGMKPFLDALKTENEKTDFEANVVKNIKSRYPIRPDGKVLFPFERLFFIAYV